MLKTQETTYPTGALTVGDKFPSFSLPACVSIDKNYFENFKQISLDDFKKKWKVIFFWPFDFTFICPTEIIDFNKSYNEFRERDAILLGISCDSEHVHLAWRKHHPELKNLQFPMISDYKKKLAQELGILHKQTEAPLRATYIVDPDNTIRSVYINDLSVGRNIKEVLRLLDAFQNGGLCPSCWEKGKDTLKVS